MHMCNKGSGGRSAPCPLRSLRLRGPGACCCWYGQKAVIRCAEHDRPLCHSDKRTLQSCRLVGGTVSATGVIRTSPYPLRKDFSHSSVLRTGASGWSAGIKGGSSKSKTEAVISLVAISHALITARSCFPIGRSNIG